MRIDLHGLILGLLPAGLRRHAIAEFFRVMIADVQAAGNDFERFSHEALYKAHANASVISLEHHIRREFDVTACIAELNGKPTDFLITIDGEVDESRLKSLINSYKLAGKSYVFKVNDVEYESQWIGHVCENMSVEYELQWINYVCENKEVVWLSVASAVKGQVAFEIQLSASKNVYSDVDVHVFVHYWRVGGNGISQMLEVDGFIQAGSSVAQINIYHNEESFNILEFTADFSVNTSEDDKYQYRNQIYQ
jgi:hypothetical protein